MSWMSWTTETIGDALNSLDVGENVKKYKYTWAICICFNMWNELSPMRIMNDTLTQLHTMRVVFFYASVHGTKSAFWARLESWSQKSKSNAGAHSSTSSTVSSPPFCKLSLHGSRDARISDPKVCTRKHARGHHPIAQTQRHDPGTRCDQSRKKADM